MNETIVNAAIEYAGPHLSCYYAFLAGADFVRDWHKPDEIPTNVESIVLFDGKKIWTESLEDTDVQSYMKIFEIKCWTYINDIICL